MFEKPFSFKGRIRRQEYALSAGLYFVLYFLLAYLTNGVPYGKEIFWVILLVLSYFMVAQGTKRCHDVGVSGLYQFIPFYFFYLLVEDGVPKKNKYGLNPKGLKGPEETGKIRQNEG